MALQVSIWKKVTVVLWPNMTYLRYGSPALAYSQPATLSAMCPWSHQWQWTVDVLDRGTCQCRGWVASEISGVAQRVLGILFKSAYLCYLFYSGFAVLVHSFTRYSLDTCYVLDTISALRKVWDETVIKQSRSIELVSC